MCEIDTQKNQLRGFYKSKRSGWTREQRAEWDNIVVTRLLCLPAYQKAKTLATYLSFSDEIDTYRLIETALSEGKRVALPVCVLGNNLEFYVVKSFNVLVKSGYGVLEPNPMLCEKIVPSVDSICVVPALAFDKEGYRLGYGGGYYDRFLSSYDGYSVGLCYTEHFTERLPRDIFDRSVDYVVDSASCFTGERKIDG